MTRRQKIVGAIIVAGMLILTYTNYKPSLKPEKANTTLMDISTFNPSVNKKLTDSNKRSDKEVTYSPKEKQVKVPGYSNPEEHY